MVQNIGSATVVSLYGINYYYNFIQMFHTSKVENYV